MIRTKYDLGNENLMYLLFEKRINRFNEFCALMPRRDAYIKNKKRKALNNKHTMGTWV